MKNYILLFGILSILSSCGKSEKEIAFENSQNQSLITQEESESVALAKKDIEKVIFKNNDEIEDSKELDLELLSKVSANLAIKYRDIKIDETSFINYNDKIDFFVITYLVKTETQENKNNDEELGDYFKRKYLFVNKTDGKIIDQELDNNLSYYENDAMRLSKTYILKNLIRLNANTTGVAFYTEEASSSHVALFSEQKFTIITLANNKIKKLLYEYPIRKTQGDSNGGGSFELETLETGMIISDTKTNGFLDLIVSKNFLYEVAVEGDVEKGTQEQSAIKVKKESERIKYNGKTYVFKKDDRYRFLDYD